MSRNVPTVASHPPWRSVLAELPSLLPLAGYIVPVGGADRNMAIECGYALSRILTIYQDRFGSTFDEGRQYTPTVPHQPLLSVDAISTALAVVGAIQVILEKLAAKRSSKSRRRLIVLLETIKAALKLACLFQTRQMLLDRGKAVSDKHCTNNSKHRYYYQGKRSGVRFGISENISNTGNAEGTVDRISTTTIPSNSLACLSNSKWWLMFGEVLHITRPPIYAQLMNKRGWVPIFVSLLLDICSRACTCQAMKSRYEETSWMPYPDEVEELRVRKMQWMFYMLRNPIFSSTTDPAAQCVVENMKWIPLANKASSWAYELLKYYSAHHFYTSAS